MTVIVTTVTVTIAMTTVTAGTEQYLFNRPGLAGAVLQTPL